MRTGWAAFALLLALPACGQSPAASGPFVVHLAMHHSHFEPSNLRVPVGRPVRFVIDNTDPIDHEWILGNQAVQDRHEKGTEPRHSARPTEQSVDALTSVTTTVVFDQPGELIYACHLPGHYAYGMHGVLVAS